VLTIKTEALITLFRAVVIFGFADLKFYLNGISTKINFYHSFRAFTGLFLKPQIKFGFGLGSGLKSLPVYKSDGDFSSSRAKWYSDLRNIEDKIEISYLVLSQNRSQLPRFHVLFYLSLNLFLLYFCLSLDISYDRSKINKQGCGLARKGHGNGVNNLQTRSCLRSRICLPVPLLLEV